MNSLYFQPQLKLLNLTPFKFSICCLIHAFLRDHNIQQKFNVLILFDGIRNLINEFKCEISKEIFFGHISEVIHTLAVKNNCGERTFEIYSIFIEIITEAYSQIKTVNDIYGFFNVQIRELKTKSTEGGDDQQLYLENGGLVDNFIRKCLFAFYKTTFEDLCKLFLQLKSYINGEDIIVLLSSKETECLFEKQMSEMSMLMDHANEDMNTKILKLGNYKQRYYFLSKSETNEEDSIYNLHKFFDYNMKMFYNETSQVDTKIHYSLLNLVEYYFDHSFFDQAIQVLFECIKLSQSNCDHEALLKSFLWLQKIFRAIGNYDIASKSLSTCLIKSFENNFHLLYLLSTVELANLNFIFHTNLGDKLNDAHMSIEERILSHSNSDVHSFKNIFQFLSSNKSDYFYERDPCKYFYYAHFNLILNLLRDGRNSLGVFFFKILIRSFLFRRNSTLGLSSPFANMSTELVDLTLNLLCEVIDFDISYAIEKIFEIYSGIYNYTSQGKSYENIIHLITVKFISFHQNSEKFISTAPESTKRNSVYICTVIEYYRLFSFVNNGNENEDQLITFKKECKKSKLIKFKEWTNILLAKLYTEQGRITEALFILNKVKEKSRENYTKMKASLAMCYVYLKLKSVENTCMLLKEIENMIEIVGCIWDKFDFYFIQSQIRLHLGSTYEEVRCDIINCFKLAIHTSNHRLIQNAYYLLQLSFHMTKSMGNSQVIKEMLNNYLKTNDSLFRIFTKFKTSCYQNLELMKAIQLNNIVMISNIEKIIN